ncbi:PsiF family protein [uncultured Alsobacter sp.]|uniref:PsiF family protein n=1 Tax=uncultured Alsobacter sp. TaxID=1748258 RepID=UPI0025EDBC0C|nr:PsiF family protein [uncultured Alsobacter sp.]
MTARILLTGAALLVALALPAAAQTSTTNPLKKPAPAAATTAPAPAAKAAPTAAPATAAAPAATAPAADGKKPPSDAQKAQQAKMKSCASEWNAMKKAGKTKGQSYRDFSSECLKKG